MTERPRTIVGRVGMAAAILAAVTALLSTLAPLVITRVVLGREDAARVEALARATAAAIAHEKREVLTTPDAAREALIESAETQARIEVWDGGRLLAEKGPGSRIGPRAGRTGRAQDGRVAFAADGPDRTLVIVAFEPSFSFDLQTRMASATLVAALVLAVGAALFATRLMRRRLEPLARLADDVATLGSPAAFQRLPLRSPDAEIRRLTTAINDAGDRVAGALDRERLFAAHAAHALRTPLTRLSLHAADEDGPVGRAVRALRNLTDSLLLYTRTGDQLATEGTAVNVADVARRVASRLPSGGSGHEVSVEAPEEAFVRGDEPLLESALEHLLDNAVKYAPERSWIRVAVESGDAGTVAVAVVDEGPGVDEADLERLFEPFVRGPHVDGHEGVGLGLAFVRRIAAAHGGRASARREGAGTRFEIALPAWSPRRLDERPAPSVRPSLRTPDLT